MRYIFEDDWIQINGFEDYIVSTSGRIFSYKRGSWKELKPQMDTDGYYQVCLFKDKKRNLRLVHRLVAEAFIPKPYGRYEVNHIDGNKLNNSIYNLEWCTRSSNMLRAHDIGLANARIPIIATNIETGEKTIFKGQHEAANILGLNQGNINHALKGRFKRYKGYIFEYPDGGDK